MRKQRIPDKVYETIGFVMAECQQQLEDNGLTPDEIEVPELLEKVISKVFNEEQDYAIIPIEELDLWKAIIEDRDEQGMEAMIESLESHIGKEN